MRNENSNRGPKIKATVKYTVTEMKNDCDAHIIHRLNTTEKRMSKLDVLLVETVVSSELVSMALPKTITSN